MSSESFKPAILTPTFNNAATLAGILARLRPLSLPLFVINDGATDETALILQRVAHDWPEIRILTHSQNRGKAAALHTGFAAAAAAGFTHALTVDTDGQHDPEQAPLLLEMARANPRALVLGARPWNPEGCPPRSTMGRRVSNALLRWESGARVSDSQTGYRVYPLALMRAIACRTGRFSFETEVIARARWAGFQVMQTPIDSRYLPPETRVSHFKPFADSMRALLLHLLLLPQAPIRRLLAPRDV